MTRKRPRSVGRKTKVPARPKPTTLIAAAAILALAAAGAYLVLAGDAPPEGAASSGACALTPVSEFADIHGLAVSSTRSDVLYAATHHGLFRAANDTDWARVGDVRDDLMGFSVHPTNGNVTWSSGHPQAGGNMGVRQSTDAGCTWTTLYTGPGGNAVDFHAMAVSPADPDALWGYYAGDIHRSTDGGHNWTVASQAPSAVFGLEPHPDDADVVYAATRDGVYRSADGGASWSLHWDTPAAALALNPRDADVWYASTGAGLHKSTDGGATWAPLPLDAGGVVGYLAISPHDPDVVYAATVETGIYKTTDGGDAWTEIKPPSR